jgi:hypothetical protein
LQASSTLLLQEYVWLSGHPTSIILNSLMEALRDIKIHPMLLKTPASEKEMFDCALFLKFVDILYQITMVAIILSS